MTVGRLEQSPGPPLTTLEPRGRRPLAPADDAKTRRAATDFESMTLDQMLQPMFATLDSDPMFGGGEAEKTLQPMLVTEMAKIMEQRGGLGLAVAIGDKMRDKQEKQR